MSDQAEPGQLSASLGRLESQLRRLRPARSSERDEAAEQAELLYRCGWEACLASQRQQPRRAGHPRRWRPFLGGAVSGIAATLVWMTLGASLSTDSSKPSRQPLMIASAELSTGSVAEEPPSGELPLDEQQFANINMDQLLTHVLPWAWLGTERLQLPATAPGVQMQTTALSPVANRSWSRVLDGAEGTRNDRSQWIQSRGNRSQSLRGMFFRSRDLDEYF